MISHANKPTKKSLNYRKFSENYQCAALRNKVEIERSMDPIDLSKDGLLTGQREELKGR